MRYQRTCIDSIGYQLAPNVVTSAALEARLAPAYRALSLQPGQLEALTGIRERRWWDPDQSMSDGAVNAARKAMRASAVPPEEIGMLIYAGVCRDQLEPATACAVADGLGLADRTEIYDISNACLGVVNGMIQVANAIELGQTRAGLIVSCESARQIVDFTVDRILANPTMEVFKKSVATLTGGSGAVAVLLTDGSFSQHQHRLLGGVIRSAPQHHELCRWGPNTGIPAAAPTVMETDAPAVLQNGVVLGTQTWRLFLEEVSWPADDNIKTICHQVGAGHQAAILQSIGIQPEQDFATFEYLGNIGTVSLPITLAIAEQRGFVRTGDRIALLGIGSGLNCLMLAVQW